MIDRYTGEEIVSPADSLFSRVAELPGTPPMRTAALSEEDADRLFPNRRNWVAIDDRQPKVRSSSELASMFFKFTDNAVDCVGLNCDGVNLRTENRATAGTGEGNAFPPLSVGERGIQCTEDQSSYDSVALGALAIHGDDSSMGDIDSVDLPNANVYRVAGERL